MNQNQVKLLWGLLACQPSPSILLAPRLCNSHAASAIHGKAGLVHCIADPLLPAMPQAHMDRLSIWLGAVKMGREEGASVDKH